VWSTYSYLSALEGALNPTYDLRLESTNIRALRLGGPCVEDGAARNRRCARKPRIVARAQLEQYDRRGLTSAEGGGVRG